MKVLYNQLHKCCLGGEKESTTGATRSDGTTEEPVMSDADIRRKQFYDLQYPKGEIAGLIPTAEEQNLDYFGLGQEASEYNLPRIDSNLQRGIDVGTPAAKELSRSNVETYQSTMESLTPGHQGLINQSVRLAQQNMAGIIGEDTASAMHRAGSYRAGASGIGYGGRSSSLTARDLGMLSWDISNTGFAQAQELYRQSAQVASDIMVRPGDMAMQLAATYNQGSLVSPELAIQSEGVNIASRFNIAEQQVANVKDDYAAKYQKLTDQIALDEADETRRIQAKEAKAARKSNLLNTIIGGVATVAGAAITGGASLAVAGATKGLSKAVTGGAGTVAGALGGFGSNVLQVAGSRAQAGQFTAYDNSEITKALSLFD